MRIESPSNQDHAAWKEFIIEKTRNDTGDRSPDARHHLDLLRIKMRAGVSLPRRALARLEADRIRSAIYVEYSGEIDEYDRLLGSVFHSTGEGTFTADHYLRDWALVSPDPANVCYPLRNVSFSVFPLPGQVASLYPM